MRDFLWRFSNLQFQLAIDSFFEILFFIAFKFLVFTATLIQFQNDFFKRNKYLLFHFQVLFPPDAKTPDEDNDGFYEFSSSLNNFTRYSGLRHLATLSYTTDMFNNASIVSSIEFDKDQEMFAIAGVTKRIKIYNYNTVLKDTVDIHYPCVEMVCGSKISCVAWSAFHQNTLASSDYDCTVIVWDALTASKVS